MYQELPRLISRLENLVPLIQDTIECAKELPPIKGGELYVTLNPGELRIDAPYNLAEYRKFRQTLKQDWKIVNKKWHEGLGKIFSKFQHKTKNIVLNLALKLEDTPLEGQTCRRIKIGETVRPVYELVCK